MPAATSSRSSRAASRSSVVGGRGENSGTSDTSSSSRSGTSTEASIRRQSGKRQRGEEGQDRAGHDERRPDAQLLDEDRAEQRAECHGHRDSDLEDTEYASEHVLVHRPLQQREARDVEQRVADADDAETDEGPPGPRPGSDERDRRAPEHERDAEDAGQLATSDEADGSQPAGERTGAERGVQPAEAGLAHAEELDRRDDKEHVQQPAHHRLRVEEQHDQARVGLERERADASEQLVAQAALDATARAGTSPSRRIREPAARTRG